ncbi:MAG: aldo/keto reductase [Clostridia bacterium]|nr:aldo/keto reductase [Clostridia bacterium]
MTYVTLGKTGIRVNKNGFGALPVQRASVEEAVAILRRAYEGGIRFFDTARAYTDSEMKLGLALSAVRGDIYLATKSTAVTGEAMKADLETSLELLKTDYIDLYQFHNATFVPRPGDGSGLYEAAMEAKAAGKIRHLGITSHRLNVAKEAIESGLYETLQFPFCYLSGDQEMELVKMCEAANMGFIAMKALSGGLITRADAAYAWLNQFPGVIPIWGVQKMTELEEFLALQNDEPTVSGEIEELIRHDREELAGDFCRGCGYCMPCPAGIVINNCARMSLLLRRAPTTNWLSETWQANMEKIEDCLHCGACIRKCPYGLNTPALLRKNLEDYRTFVKP